MNVRAVDFFAYRTDDMQRPIEFYRQMFDLEPVAVLEHEGQQYWAEYDINGTTLALHLPHVGPEHGAVALAVHDVQAAVDELVAKGAEVVFGPMDSSVCWVATVLGPDGNAIFLHRRHDGTRG